VVGPLGLQVPLQWRFSHGHSEKDYFVVCWRVSGNLYISVGVEPSSYTQTVIIMDKAKLEIEKGQNIVSAYSRGSKKFATLDDYIEWFKPLIVGVWTRSGGSDKWMKVSV
jgi:hypothetical protein